MVLRPHISSRRWSRGSTLFGLSLIWQAATAQTTVDPVSFVCRELLGRPTATSVALNVCTDRDAELYVEYGTQSMALTGRTPEVTARGGVPVTVPILPLVADTRYYYRVRYRPVGTTDYFAREEHTFHTARGRGSAFVFAIEADPHLDVATNPDLYRRTLTNILAGSPDFLIDLGDSFMSDKLPVKDFPGVTSRHLLLRSFYDTLGHSVPLMLVLGNHEGELGWLLNGTPDNLAIWASQVRTSYYPNPAPNDFYTGDTTREDFVGLRQSYYAWEWGNALFVVLDPYWHTSKKPGTTNDLWNWTLGERQYRWLQNTLAASTAPLKFVFAHHLVGGNDPEGRGGVEAVPFYEMGGRNADSTWGFAAARPGWPRPLHQLMVDNHVTAFFHGHDHVFVKQDLDGIVYQELPQPGYFNYSAPERSYSNIGLAAKYGYTHGIVLSSSGYLKVSVTDTGATVAYVRSYLPEHENGQRSNGETAFSYFLRPSGSATSVADQHGLPHHVTLEQNYPNPFNGISEFGFHISDFGSVKLRMFDLLGREVAVLVDDVRGPGAYRVRWDAGSVPSGVYVCALETRTLRLVRKMVLVR